MLHQPQMRMMAGTRAEHLGIGIGIESVCHTTANSAGVACDSDVRCIARSTELAEAQRRRAASDVPLVHKFKPWEIRQMSLAAGEQKSNGQCRGWPTTSAFETPLVNIAGSIRPVWILDQLENAGFHGGQSVAKRATHPPRKGHHRHSNGRCSWVAIHA